MEVYGGARGGGKSPLHMIIQLIKRFDDWEHQRKSYRKARWKKSNTRAIRRALKKAGFHSLKEAQHEEHNDPQP